MLSVLIVICGVLGAMACSLILISFELKERNRLLKKQMESNWSFQNEKSK